MHIRPWPRGYDQLILRAMESALPALATRFERSDLETRMRWYELKDRFKRAPSNKSHIVYTTAAQRRKMIQMREAGEKIEYIAVMTGFSNACVSKHTSIKEHA